MIGPVRSAPCASQSREILFAFPENIEDQGAKLFTELRAADYLKGRSGTRFAEGAAHFLAELNAIHAFREGNGRSQLTFFGLLAEAAGHPVKFSKLDPEAMLHAMVASFEGDESELAKVIKRLIT